VRYTWIILGANKVGGHGDAPVRTDNAHGFTLSTLLAAVLCKRMSGYLCNAYLGQWGSDHRHGRLIDLLWRLEEETGERAVLTSLRIQTRNVVWATEEERRSIGRYEKTGGMG